MSLSLGFVGEGELHGLGVGENRIVCMEDAWHNAVVIASKCQTPFDTPYAWHRSGERQSD